MQSSIKKPINILFTIPNFITAGSGHAMLQVVRRLNPDLFCPSICVLKTGGGLEAEIQELGIPLLELPFTIEARPAISLPWRIWQASRLFRPYNFQLWQSFHYSDDYTEPLIARASGARGWIYTKKNMSWGGRAWKFRSFLASRIPAQNSAMIERFFTHPRLRAKAQLLPPSVDMTLFYPGVEPRLQLRQRLGISADTFLVGCVAHLVEVKGIPTLIRAAANLEDVHIAIAGKPLDAEYAAGLEQLCKELGVEQRVHFLGGVADIPALHAELDLFVLPTLGRLRMEGCPVAMLEAMACGLPVVISDIPGPQDVIKPDVNGLLVPPENVEALTSAIRTLKESPDTRQRLGEAAHQHIVANYTVEREVAQYEALYTELLGL